MAHAKLKGRHRDDPDDRRGPEERQLAARLEANIAAAEKALRKALTTPTVPGSTGQTKANPLFEVAARCDELALRFAEELRKLRHRRSQETEDNFAVTRVEKTPQLGGSPTRPGGTPSRRS